MRDDILDEREMLLSAQPAGAARAPAKLFSSYDPTVSMEAFRQLLRLYGYPFNNRRLSGVELLAARSACEPPGVT